MDNEFSTFFDSSKFIEKIGKGAFSEVFRIIDPNSNKPFAVKKVSSKDQNRHSKCR